MIAIGLALGSLSGCASTPKQAKDQLRVPELRQSDIGNQPIYVEMKWNNDHQWFFTNFHSMNSDPDGPRIKLGIEYDVVPTHKNELCLRGLLGLTEGSCGTGKKDRVHRINEYSVHPMNFVLIPFGWPIIFGIGAVAMMDGEFNTGFFLPIAFDQSFDWAEYASIISDIRIKENHAERLPLIYQRYHALNSKAAEGDKLPEQADTIQKDIRSRIYSDVKNQVSLMVNNRSGLPLYDALAEDTKATLELSLGSIESAPFESKFQNEMRAVTGKLGDSLTEVEATLTRWESASSQLHEQNQQWFDEYVAHLEKGEGRVTLTATHNTDRLLKNYDYTLNMPETIDVKGGKLTRPAKAELVVTGQDLKDVMPTAYLSANKDVSVKLDGNRITITNNANRYISVGAISLYHNNDVLTVGGDNYQNYMELAPNTYKSISLNAFNLTALANDYNNLNAQKAKNTHITFGFALKYAITELQVNHTLFKTYNYSLYDLVKGS